MYYKAPEAEKGFEVRRLAPLEMNKFDRAREEFLLILVSQPDWIIQSTDPRMPVGEVARAKTNMGQEEFKGVAMGLVRDGIIKPIRSNPHTKQPNIWAGSLHHPAKGALRPYISERIIEAALNPSSKKVKAA